MKRHGSDDPAAIHSLTEREQEVLHLMAQGYSNREIAGQMVVALSTVKWYARQIFSKLDVEGRKEAVERARTLGPLPLVGDSAPVGNLPASVSSFVGREKEIGDIRLLLKRVRLVTLSGAAGSGKTRLALHVARLIAGDYPDGAFYVSLATTQDPLLVPKAIAHVWGVAEQADRSLVQTLQRHTAHKRMLVILDNFEHLLDAAWVISELLGSSPHLTFLVTSREPLRLRGEHEYLVPPLHLPDPTGKTPMPDLMSVESVSLFVQRARMVSRDFRLTPDNAADVAEICRRLDGLPLAIELAAPRTKLFSPSQMLERLQSRLRLLVRGPRDLPERQRTLRSTLDWSFNLLDPAEQRLFACLSVFNWGRTIAGVEAVCNPEDGVEALAGLESLLNKNLIFQKEGPGGEPRFYMLETMHEYADERLRESGEETVMRNRHLDYFVSYCEAMAPGYLRRGQMTLFRKTEAEIANIRTCYEWAVESGQVDKAARLITAVNYYFRYATEHVVEGYRLARCLLPHEAELPLQVRIPYLAGVSELAFQTNQIVRSQRLAARAQKLAEGWGDKRLLAWALVLVSAMSRDDPAYAAAISNGRRSEDLFRELGEKSGLAYALNRLGEVYRLGGELDRAQEAYEESLALCQETGEVIREQFLYGGLGLVAYGKGDYERSKALVRESLNRLEFSQWTHWTITALADLTGPLAKLGEEEKAARICGACARLTSELGVSYHPNDKSTIEFFEADLRVMMGESAFAAAWSEGQQMTYEELLSYALDGQNMVQP